MLYNPINHPCLKAIFHAHMQPMVLEYAHQPLPSKITQSCRFLYTSTMGCIWDEISHPSIWGTISRVAHSPKYRTGWWGLDRDLPHRWSPSEVWRFWTNRYQHKNSRNTLQVHKASVFFCSDLSSCLMKIHSPTGCRPSEKNLECFSGEIHF